MNERKIKDLTVGNPLKLIVGFTIPIFFGMLFQQFYSVMDTVIVGQTLGVEALAAVGATGSITFLIFGFCNGIASGFAIPVAWVLADAFLIPAFFYVRKKVQRRFEGNEMTIQA